MSRKEKRREWIEALRSGKYEQTQNYLRYQGLISGMSLLLIIFHTERVQ